MSDRSENILLPREGLRKRYSFECGNSSDNFHDNWFSDFGRKISPEFIHGKTYFNSFQNGSRLKFSNNLMFRIKIHIKKPFI